MFGFLANINWGTFSMVLDDYRDKFKSGEITEAEFRRQLRRRGYTEYGADREIEDQLSLKKMEAR